MLTIVQGNRNIYTISKGETDWKAGAKLWPYCKWLPYCSIWRAPPPTWWLYFPLDLWLSPESRRPPPRVCAASPAERDERQWDERRRWAGGRQRSLLVGSCWQQAAFFYLLFVFCFFFRCKQSAHHGGFRAASGYGRGKGQRLVWCQERWLHQNVTLFSRKEMQSAQTKATLTTAVTQP